MRAELGLEGLAERLPWSRRRVELINVRRLERAWKNEVLRREHGCRPLRAFERSVFSQNGEDGILERIFDQIGSTARSFVEIGASDGVENCTRNLMEAGWTGIWIEADPARARSAKGHAAGRVTVIDEPAEPLTIAALLRRNGVPDRPDLLVVDIDGNDWWVLGATLSVVSPRVLVAEYNPTYPPGRWWVQPYRANRTWDGTFRHGASLEAVSALAHFFGLALVGCDSRGVNAFFVAKDEVGRVDCAHAGQVGVHYIAPWFAFGTWGHPRSPERSRLPMARLPSDELARISFSAVRRPRRSAIVQPGQPVLIEVAIRNGSRAVLSSSGPTPLQIALRWRRYETPYEPWTDEERVRMRHSIAPGRSGRITIWRSAPTEAGRHHLDLVLVQENVAVLAESAKTIELTVGV